MRGDLANRLPREGERRAPMACRRLRDGRLLLSRPQRIRAADIGAGSCHACLQAIEHLRLPRTSADQVKDVHGPPLANPIDSADALFEPHRIPRQLEVDDEPAGLVKVQAFARGVGGQQDPDGSRRELFEHTQPFVARQAAVENDGRLAQRRLKVQQRVSILGEDDDRLVDAAQAGGGAPRPWSRGRRRPQPRPEALAAGAARVADCQASSVVTTAAPRRRKSARPIGSARGSSS